MDRRVTRRTRRVVYDPGGAQRIANHRDDDAAWHAISHAAATKDIWVGEQPYSDWDWDWLEHPEDLTAEDRYAQEEVEEADEEDDDLEWTPTR